MLRRLLVIGATLAGFGAAPVLACPTLEPGPTGRVVSVSDGDTLDLDIGLTVRLVGIQAPKLPLGRPGFTAWPLGEGAREALLALTRDRPVALHYGGERADRHGRALAHLLVGTGDDRVWVQEALVEAGLARVYSFPDNRSCLAELLAAERRARAERRGIWTDPFYAIRDAADERTLARRADQYELVEGRVLNAALSGGRVYLNFGRHWRTDFTVVVERAGQRLFEADGLDLLALENRVIRVRGWIEELDGPRMLVTHPEQIEILGSP